mmetsp:Transcript_14592/g.57401  ORF Transcript_14592/g.57401 Transcript_14592/m.57401 type:complete len:335 (-) Transcript_14592:163-1167(-)
MRLEAQRAHAGGDVLRRVHPRRPPPLRELPEGSQGLRPLLQPRRGHGRHGLHPVQPLRDLLQQRHDLIQRDGGVPRRGHHPRLLRLLRVHLPRGRAAHHRALRRAQGIRRLARAAPGRVRPREARVRGGVQALPVRLRDPDPHRALPQHLRPLWHLEGGPREGASRVLPQGGHRHHRGGDVGRRQADPFVHLHRRLRRGYHPSHEVRLRRARQPGLRRDGEHERDAGAGAGFRGQAGHAHQAHPGSRGRARPQLQQRPHQGEARVRAFRQARGRPQGDLRVDRGEDQGGGGGGCQRRGGVLQVHHLRHHGAHRARRAPRRRRAREPRQVNGYAA